MIYRERGDTKYHHSLGKDAIEALKAYLTDIKLRGLKLKDDDPLFMQISLGQIYCSTTI